MKKEPILWLLIAGMVIYITGVQLGINKGRDLAAADVGARRAMPLQITMDKLQADLNAARFDADVERRKLSIILCESGARHQGVWGDGGRSYGIAQFQYATFNELRKEAGRPDLRWKIRHDQLWLLDWALRHGYGKYWACYSKREKREDTL